MSESKSRSNGIGFIGLLTIAFIVLKLCGVINWSWWWVLSPLWAGMALCFVAAIVVFVAMVIVKVLELRSGKKS